MKSYLLLISSFALSLCLMACSSQTTDQAEPITKKQSEGKPYITGVTPIKLKDPKASMVGYKNPGEDYFKISLEDVGKYTGHICTGVATGYLLTSQALQLLYPNHEIPVRGQISLAGSDRIDPYEVASYIVRASEHSGQLPESNHGIIDSSLQNNLGIHTFIFKRADTGAMVKAEFHKYKLVDPKNIPLMLAMKEKIMEGRASEKEKLIFAERVQNMVKKVLTDLPEGVITVEKITDYQFPKH